MSPEREPVDFEPAARVIADSVSPAGYRLSTLEVRLHRFVLAEFNTHRALSRNSASSRAIPVSRTLASIAEEPAVPLFWPGEQRGMQGGANLSHDGEEKARQIWLDARDAAVHHAEQLYALGVHKSVTNRLLEPFMSHTVIVSATDWDNFWHQRCSPLAQPEIRFAAEAMRAAYRHSRPRLVGWGEWHLPYISDDERRTHDLATLTRVSAARCARVSYLTHDGRRSISDDLRLWRRLIDARPPHASPLEHVAIPTGAYYDNPGNFTGWEQLRHLILAA